MRKGRVLSKWGRVAASIFIALVAVAPVLSPSAQGQGVTVAWGPSTDPTVVGYNLYYGEASKTYTNMVAFGNVTNVTVLGLLAGAEYFFAATAVDSVGLESSFSNEISYLVPGGSTNPAAPAITAFAANPLVISAGQSAVLSWMVTGTPAPALSIDNGVGTVSGSSTVVAPATTTTYTLTATNSSGATTAQTTVTVAAAPVISFLQAASGSSDGQVSSLAANALTTTAGDLLVAAVTWDTSAASTVSISDSEGNAWAAATTPQVDTRHNQALQVFYAPNIAGGSDSVTVVPSPAAGWVRLIVHEVTGVALTAPLDQTAVNNTGSGTTLSVGPVTTAAADEYIFTAAMIDGSDPSATFSAGSGYTLRAVVAAADSELASADQVQSAAGSVSSVWALSGSADSLAQMATFQAAGASAAPPITWPTPADIVYGTALGAGQLNATSSVPGTFTYNPTAGTVLNAGSQVLSVTFNPTDTGSYRPVTTNVALVVLPETLTVTAANTSKLYGAPVPALTASYSGFVNGDTASSLTTPPTLATTATAASPVGSYPITASGAASPNYTISYASGTLSVNAAALTITAVSTSKLYGAAVPALTASYSGFVNGDTASSLTTPPTLATTATAASPVGSYMITASGAASPNYTISYASGTLTVNKAVLTITAVSTSKLYGAAVPALTASYSGFVNGDTASSLTTPPSLSTTATAASSVGSYMITASGAASPNYTISYASGTLTVNAAALTITAVSTSKLYGAVVPALTASYSGFVNGDTASSLTTPPSLTTTATAASGVGSYPITASGAASPNYTISSASGTLTVNKAALTVTAVSASKLYGAAVPALTASYSGFVNGDTASKLTTRPTVATTATAASPVGSYTISASGAASPNYTISYASGTLTVTRAALKITAANTSKLYLAPLPALTANYSGFVNGDTASSLTTPPTLTTTATAASPVGTYPITASGAASPNYTISYVSGTLTVTKTAPKVVVHTGFSRNLVITNLGNGSVAIGGEGVPGSTYIIQRITGTLPTTNWLTLGTVTADPSGAFVLVDTAGSGLRFYRAIYP
jgi:hypothetical protein